MSAQQIADRVFLVIVLTLGVCLGAYVGDVGKALTSLAVGIFFSEAFDLAWRWGRDAWPTVKHWWTR